MQRERRRHERHACFLKAELRIPGHEDAVPAEALDISDSGFRLTLPATVGIPDQFMLIIPRRKIRENVKIVRKNARELGVTIEHKEAMPELKPVETRNQVSKSHTPVMAVKSERPAERPAFRLIKYRKWLKRIWA